MKEIIFVAGIHGVGKTTFCSNLSKSIDRDYYSCSDLIRQYKALPKHNKFVSKIDSNQLILKKAIDNLLNDKDSFILDGHFCLLDSNSKIVKLSLETFKFLNISKVILLSLPLQKVLENLRYRDKTKYSLDLIEKFSNEELIHCKFICENLNIPFEIIRRY